MCGITHNEGGIQKEPCCLQLDTILFSFLFETIVLCKRNLTFTIALFN